MKALMLDIETYGVLPTSIVLSIGAVVMNFDDSTIGQRMHVNIDMEDCEFYGMTSDQSTIDFWAKQSPEAKRRTFNKDTAVKLKDALTRLTKFHQASGASEVWACGSDFDFPILTNAFSLVGMDVPWRFWDQRDYRTMGAAHSVDVPKPAKSKGTHDALVDAEHQANHLLVIFKHIDLLRAGNGVISEFKRKAVIDAHPHLSSFLAARKFGDEDRVRAVLVEYEKHVAMRQVSGKTEASAAVEEEL